MATDGAAASSLARSLIGGALHVRSGENVVIETWNHTLDYARACVVEARRIGAHPLLWLEDEPAYWRSVEEAPTVKGWSKPGEHEWSALARSHAYVFFPGPADRPRLTQLPPKRMERVAYNGEWYRRAKKARLRGVRSVLGYASDAQAERWGVSGVAWRDQLIRAATEVDLAVVHDDAKRAAQKLRTGREDRVTAPNGTDISMKLRHRTPYIDDGSVTSEDLAIGANMTVSPPGTVLVAVDEKSANGLAIANRPSYLRAGRVEGGQWEAKAGKVSNIWYTEGQAEFDAAFQAAPKGSDVLSIFSIGLNPSLDPGVPQVEDQEAGAVTLGIGGNTGYGGSNKCPFLSWIVIGEATVAVDGKPLCDRGKLLSPGPLHSRFAAPLPAGFYDRATPLVARELLGAWILVRDGRRVRGGRIVETEAYVAHDAANHASRGATPRNRTMFGPPGSLYVYRIHQVHCANAVTQPGEAVLLRAAEPLHPDLPSLTGPGRLCRGLGVTRADDGSTLVSGRVRIVAGDSVPNAVARTRRVGISRAVELPLRFLWKGHASVSRPRPWGRTRA